MKDNAIPVDLSGDGLLWLINRVVFHPRGFHLWYNDADGAFSLEYAGEWLFDGATDDGKFSAVRSVLERAADEHLRASL